MIPIANPKYVTNGRDWTRSDDHILKLLRNDTAANLSLTDISKGMFGRTKSAVAGRLYKLRIAHEVM